MDNLVKRVQNFEARWIRSLGAHTLPITVFKQNDKKDFSSCGINGNFLFSQLLIDNLLQMNYQSTDMNEFIEVCAKEFAGNKQRSKDLHTFSNDYKPEKALTWYTKPIFLYSLLNKALRLQNIELLFLLRFFIRDIYRELTRNQCQSSVKVYRGQLMSSEEVETLKKSIDDLVSMNSFFSTSFDREKAEFYLGGASLTSSNHFDSSSVPVLFEIIADPNIKETKTRPFADITQFSEFLDDEEEVLFMVGSIFRVLDVNVKNNKYVVSLQLSGGIEEDMQELLDHLKAKRRIAVDSDTSLVTFIDILCDMNKSDLVEKFAKRALYEISITAHSCSVNVIDIAKCHLYLGRIACQHERFDKALEEFNAALELVLSMKEPDPKALATINTAIAKNFDEQKQYKRALDYYNKAVDILQQDNNGNSSQLAALYTSMGWSYRQKKNYERALQCHQEALSLQEKCLPKFHYDLALTYKVLAAIHFDLHEYDQALDSCQKALDIESKSLPYDHPKVAATYENMAVICEQVNDIQRATGCLDKASAIDHRPTFIPRSRFAITTFVCPWCHHHVWIYNMFRFVKGAPCFACLCKLVGIRR